MAGIRVTDLRRIGVFGAGAVGSLVAARLAGAGHDVTLVARGRRLQEVAGAGLRLRLSGGAQRTIRVTARAAADAGVQDVVFIAVKAGDLPAARLDLLSIVGPDTVVVPLVNGIPWWYHQPRASTPVIAVDPDGALAAAFDPRRVVGAVVFLTSVLAADGGIAVRGTERLIFGPVAGDDMTITHRVAKLFSGSGIAAQTVPDLRADLWSKVALNLATNPLSVLAGATLEEQFHVPALRFIVATILDETISVARAHGAESRLSTGQMLDLGSQVGPFYTSMAQDHHRGTPLELGAICQSVFDLAAHVGRPMPMAHAVHAVCRSTFRRRLPLANEECIAEYQEYAAADDGAVKRIRQALQHSSPAIWNDRETLAAIARGSR